jgi:HEAT repeat protein
MSRTDLDDAQIVVALRAVGIHVSSVFDLVNNPEPRAVPVLLSYLAKDMDSWIKEGIVRALTIRQAKPIVLRPMLESFRRQNIGDSLRWAIGNAIYVLASEEVLDELVDLIQDTRFGRARQMVVLAVGKIKAAGKNARALQTLLRLLKDEEVRGHAIAALGKLQARKARAKIAQFLDSPNAWIRREAKKALERIDKASGERKQKI